MLQSTLAMLSLKRSGKSWKELGENFLFQNSIRESGGGGPISSKFSVDVLEQLDLMSSSLLIDESSEAVDDELVQYVSGGGPKRVSEEEVVLTSSGV